MHRSTESRPELSYVLAALTTEEVHDAASWLREHPVSSRVEVVLAAPARALGRVAARVIPQWVRLASAELGEDRKAIRVAGARSTTGLVVIVIDCDDDFDQKLRDPFQTGSEPVTASFEDPVSWAGELEPGSRPISFISHSGQIAPAAH